MSKIIAIVVSVFLSVPVMADFLPPIDQKEIDLEKDLYLAYQELNFCDAKLHYEIVKNFIEGQSHEIKIDTGVGNLLEILGPLWKPVVQDQTEVSPMVREVKENALHGTFALGSSPTFVDFIKNTDTMQFHQAPCAKEAADIQGPLENYLNYEASLAAEHGTFESRWWPGK